MLLDNHPKIYYNITRPGVRTGWRNDAKSVTQVSLPRGSAQLAGGEKKKMTDKKKNNLKTQSDMPEVKGITAAGKKVILAGILILITGFFILTKTDPEGQNWASVLSPFLIVGAYIIIAIGIILPDKTSAGTTQQQAK